MAPHQFQIIQSQAADSPQAPLSTPAGPKPKRLMDQLRDAIQLRHYSIRTEQSYVHWAVRYILFHNKRHPQEMGAPEIEAFLTHLAVARQVSASTQNVALNALVFLYTEVLKREFGTLKDITRA